MWVKPQTGKSLYLVSDGWIWNSGKFHNGSNNEQGNITYYNMQSVRGVDPCHGEEKLTPALPYIRVLPPCGIPTAHTTISPSIHLILAD